jgi:hypothetical protein
MLHARTGTGAATPPLGGPSSVPLLARAPAALSAPGPAGAAAVRA